MAIRKQALSKQAFTEKRVASLPKPSNGRAYHYDAKITGLAVCVTATDTRVWYLLRKLRGQTVRIRLGTTAELTVDQARTRAADLLGQIARGANPHAAHLALRGEPTLGHLWSYWLENHAKKHKRSWKEDERQYNSFLKRWSGRKLSAISRAAVQKLHKDVGTANGHYAANRMLAMLSAMFGKNMEHASELGYRGENPAKGIRRFAEEKRDRFLSADELARFLQALHQEPSETMQDFFLVALLTGARRANVQAMRWEDVNLEWASWSIPGAVSKSGQTIMVPLVPAVVAILKRRRQADSGSPWVFPSYGKTGHVVEPKAAWKRILLRAGLSDLRPHDLRRTFGSWQAISGASLPIIGKSLGHTQPSTTAIYARLQMDPVRQSVETATTAMLATDRTQSGEAANGICAATGDR
jgi:integrase